MAQRKQTLTRVLVWTFVLVLVAAVFWHRYVALKQGPQGPAGPAQEPMTPAAPGQELRVRPNAAAAGRYQTAFQAMGTDVNLEVAAPSQEVARAMFLAARRKVEEVERMVSTDLPDSEVSRLNHDGAAQVSEGTLAVLRKAQELSHLSDGTFDVTGAPLRMLWHKAAAGNTLPTDAQIQDALRAVGYDKLGMSGRQVRFTLPGMAVDLGPVAAGYAIDTAMVALQDAGATAGIVDIGGDLRLFGHPADRDTWRISVAPPRGAKGQVLLEVPPCAVVTSAEYAGGYRVEGKVYSHVIDPRTGRPIEGIASITIVAPDAVTADGLAVAVSVMGWPKGMELVRSQPGVECLMLLRRSDGSVEEHQSKGFGKLMEKG